VIPSPTPARSHVAGGFPALHAPAPPDLCDPRVEPSSRRMVGPVRSCRLMGAFISSPLPPVLLRNVVQQGPFALRTLLCFIATTKLGATVSPSVDFPVDAGYTTALASADFSVGTRTVSPVARFVLVIVPSLPPRRSDVSLRSVCDASCGLRSHPRISASGT
jgi:hypothetical protein